MNQNTRFETDAYQIEKIAGMTDAYPYCMHRRDLTEFVVPWHWHEELELGYLECGESVIQTLHADYELRAGEGFFINTNVMDRKYNARPGTPVREINHIFHPVFLGGHFHSRFESKYLYPILKNQQLEVHIIRPTQPSGQALLQKLRALHDLQALPDTEFQTRGLLGECWLLLLQSIRESSPRRAESPYSPRDCTHSRSVSADAEALRRLPGRTVAPGQLFFRISAILPMELPPDVANGTTVLPVSSHCSRNACTMRGASYHQIGKPTKITS